MRWTRASVEEYAKDKGFEPVKVEGIPDGFVWKEPDVTIGGTTHEGKYTLFGPLGEDVVSHDDPKALVDVYNSFKR